VFTKQWRDRVAADLVGKVAAHGYQLDVIDLQRNTRPSGDRMLGNSELRLRDRRAEHAGDVTVRCTVQPSGAMLGVIEATDSEPGFYDELAQYVIAELGGLVDDLEFKSATSDERRPAISLRAELSSPPLGLALLRD
jgi:hypothetical protein